MKKTKYTKLTPEQAADVLDRYVNTLDIDPLATKEDRVKFRILYHIFERKFAAAKALADRFPELLTR